MKRVDDKSSSISLSSRRSVISAAVKFCHIILGLCTFSTKTRNTFVTEQCKRIKKLIEDC